MMPGGEESPPGDGSAGGDSSPLDKKQLVGQYELGKVIGAGAFSKVRLATKAGSKDETFAVKIVLKDSIRDIRDLERVMREMHVLKNLSHPNIISMHESVEKGSKLYLVLDYAAGGELYDYCMAKGPLPEKLARVFMSQILTGVDFLHRQGVSHRDLKPENVLLVQATGGSGNKSDGFVCKIADFGLSNDFSPGDMLKTICGTPTYVAPEITMGDKYDGVAVDLWSCGCILLFMLAAAPAFSAENQGALFDLIRRAAFKVPIFCSPEASDLIQNFLQVNPARRISIGQCWQHAWLAHSFARGPFDLGSQFDDDEIEKELQAITLERQAEGSGQEAAKGGGEACDAAQNSSPSHPNPCSQDSSSEVQRLELVASGVAIAALSSAPALPLQGGMQEVEVIVCGQEASVGATGGVGEDCGGASTTLRLVWHPKNLKSSTSPILPAEARRESLELGASVHTLSSSPSTQAPRPAPGRRATISGAIPGTRPTRSAGAGAAAHEPTSATRSFPAHSSDSASSSSLPASRPSGEKLCAVVTKDAKVVLKDLVRLLSDYKVSVRSQAGWTFKAEKNRVRFDIALFRILEVGGKKSQSLHLVAATRVTGDTATFRDMTRRLLVKL